MTNADRIRSFSDEMLARMYINSLDYHYQCPYDKLPDELRPKECEEDDDFYCDTCIDLWAKREYVPWEKEGEE